MWPANGGYYEPGISYWRQQGQLCRWGNLWQQQGQHDSRAVGRERSGPGAEEQLPS